MKHNGKRLLSMLMAAVMILGCLPADAIAVDEPVIAEQTEPVQPTEAVPEETPEETPEEIPEETPEDTPEEVPEIQDQTMLAEIDMSDPSTWPTAGTLGEDGQFTWAMDTQISSNYILTIRGSGDLPDWGEYDQKPWYPWRVNEVRLIGDITAIGDYLFNYGSIERINLPATLTRIGDYALEDAGLTGISIPYGVTEIGDSAFNGATLEWVDIPDTVETIGDYAFAHTKLKTVVIPDSVTELGAGAFQASELRSFVLPDHMTDIPDYCFNAVEELTEWEIPAHITSIGDYAFRNTGLKQLYIPDTVTEIGEYAFAGSKLESVTMAADISELPKNCFRGCQNLDWVDIQSPVTEIPEGCFYQCGALRGVILPETVEFVHNTGFYQNENLQGVFARGPGVDSNADLTNAFKGGRDTPTVYYMEGQTGWAGLEDEGSSDTEWYGHPLEKWDGVNAELPNTAMGDYYGTPEEKFFCIQVPGASYPHPTGFQIQVGEMIYNTGKQERITIPIPEDYAGTIIFSKEGYITYEMPAELAGTFNWVTMWPDDGGTSPVLQAIYIDKSSGGYKSFGNLKTQDYSIYELNERYRRFYVSVIWRDGEEGTISLVQDGKKIVQLENNAWTTFQPGMKFTAKGKTIYLQAENSKRRVTTNLQLHMRTPTKEMDVPFGGAVSGISGTACEAMQNSKLEMEINGKNLPVTIKMEDGKVIGVIGIKAEADKAEAAFNHAKELVDKADAGMGEDIFTQFSNLYKAYNGKKDVWPKRQSSMVIESDIQFLGYLEGRFVEYEGGETKLEFGMSKLAMKLEGTAAYTQQTFVIGIPLYWQLELGAMLELAFQLYQDNGIASATMPELNMQAELSLAGTLAVGIVDVVSAGVKAKGAFEAESKLPIDPDDMTLKLTGDISAFVTLVGLTGEKTLLDGEYIFYEDGVWYPEERSRLLTVQMAEEDLELTKASREYLEDGTYFVANDNPRTRALVPENGTVTTKQIMVNNYPYAEPDLITQPDGDQVLVWLEDDGTPNEGSALYFSVYNGKNWSEPELVEDDGTSDFSPELKLVDDTLYLMWLDAEDEIPADCTDVAEISAMLDVSVACFDAETLVFEEAVTFGESGEMDILPDVTVYQKQPVVVWVNSDGSLLSMDACDLWCAVQTEDGWEESELYSGLGDVDSLCADLLQGALSVSFSQSAGNKSGIEEKEIFTLRYLMEDGQLEQLGKMLRRTDNDVADTAPVNYHGLLYWYQDGTLVNTAGQSLKIGGSGSRYQIIDDGDGNNAVIYAVAQPDNTFRFYTVMDNGTGWSQPVLAASSTGWVESWSAQFNSRGYLTIAASEREDGDPNGEAGLTVYTIQPKKDLAVNTVYYDGYTLVPGQELTVYAEVENLGLTEVSYYTLTGKFDGRSAGSFSGGVLRPGEKVTVSFACTVPVGGAEELAVSLGSDTNNDNNACECTLAMQDLSVENVALSLNPDGNGEVTVSVINRGMTTGGSAVLVLKKAVPADGEETQWEILAEPQSVDTLEPQHMTEYTFTLNTSVAQGDLVYAVLEVEDADSLIENNSEFAVADLPKSGEVDFGGSKIVSVEDGVAQVQISVVNESGEAVSGCILVAAYDGGKMTDVRMMEVSVPHGTCLVEQLELTCPKNGEVRMYVVDMTTLLPLHEMHILEE